MKWFAKRSFWIMALLGAMLLSLTACQQWTGSVIWTMCIFFFWFLYIWIFITVFADILRRNDLSGGKKAMWLILIIFLTFIGLLAYMIARPKMTEQDKQMMEEAEARQKRMAGYSAADEIAKTQALLASGAITQAEFEEMKRKAMV